MKVKHILYAIGGLLLISAFLGRKKIMKFAKAELVYLSKGGKSGYITHLYNTFKQKENMLKKIWTKDKVIEEIKKAALRNNIPYGALYSIIAKESNFIPVGTTKVYGDNVDALIKNNATAYGMGQVLLSSFINDVQDYPDVNYMHEDLWNPEYGIDAAAKVFKTKLKYAGGNIRRAMELYRGVDYYKKEGKISEYEKAMKDVDERMRIMSDVESGKLPRVEGNKVRYV